MASTAQTTVGSEELSEKMTDSVLEFQGIQDGSDVDEAMEAYHTMERDGLQLNEVTRKRLLRKIDMFIMPMLCIVYGLQYLDKTSLSYASVMGIEKDIGLKGQDYSWLGSPSTSFCQGYLGMEFPTGRLLQRLPLGKYLAIWIILWGLVNTCFAAVHDFRGAVAIRFLLGVCEACVSPGFALVTSQWYTRAEQSSRMSIWVSFNGFAAAFGGTVAYGLAQGYRVHPFNLAPWKFFFLLTGLLTIIVGGVVFIYLPNNPLHTWWLSPNERVLAVERIRENQQGIGNKRFKVYQFKEALIDPLTWLTSSFILMVSIPNGGLGSFFALVIVSFGYTPQQALLYNIPSGAIAVVANIAWGLLSRRYGHRILLAILSFSICTAGGIMLVAMPTNNRSGRLWGIYLAGSLYLPAFIATLSLISSNVAGYTKKTTVLAIFWIGYCIGNILGPQTFRAKDAPDYVPAKVTILVLEIAAILDLLLMYFYLRWRNTRLAKARAQPGYVKQKGQEFRDLTDWENPETVYVL